MKHILSMFSKSVTKPTPNAKMFPLFLMKASLKHPNYKFYLPEEKEFNTHELL